MISFITHSHLLNAMARSTAYCSISCSGRYGHIFKYTEPMLYIASDHYSFILSISIKQVLIVSLRPTTKFVLKRITRNELPLR